MDIICSEFLENFIEDLTLIPSNIQTKKYDDTSKELIEYIEKYNSIRELFLNFLDKITKNQEVELVLDSMITFFEELEFMGSNFNRNTERADKLFYSFVLIELFLYCIAIALKNKKYSFVSKLIQSPYFFKEHGNEAEFFVKINFNRDLINVLTYYVNNFQKRNKISPIGEMIIERLPHNIKNDWIVDADLICFYVTLIYYNEFGDVWIPYTYPYKKEEHVELIRKLSKKSHFNKVKCIFKVNTINEMKTKFSSIPYETYTHYTLGNSFYYPLPLYESINYENIGKYLY